MIYYLAIPLISTATSGETNRGVLQQELEMAKAEQAETFEKILKTSSEDIQSDENLFRLALAGGASLYKVHCSQCHGSGAESTAGFPNLIDDDWLWGGDLQNIYMTIYHGVRHEDDPETRFSLMPSFGADDSLPTNEINTVTNYVLKLSGQSHDAEKAQTGAVLYADNCASCHADMGLGDTSLVASNLADALWLYGASAEEISAQIQQPKHGVMLAWGERLGEVAIKQLALYVHSVGGGE